MVALKAPRPAPTPQLPDGERVYAIGDVHGRADLLDKLSEKIEHDNHTRSSAHTTIIMLGDLIDRGPSSAQIIAGCRRLSESHTDFVVLKGNHEAMMVDALQGNFPAFALWLRHGGDVALQSWGVRSDKLRNGATLELLEASRACISPEEIDWVAHRPMTHLLGNCLFVHAGIRPGIALSRQLATDLLWIRGEFTDSEEPLSHVVVHGHSISDTTPVLRHGRYGIDTGAYRTGRLTALGLEGDQSWIIDTEDKQADFPSTRRIEPDGHLDTRLEHSFDAVFGRLLAANEVRDVARASRKPKVIVASVIVLAATIFSLGTLYTGVRHPVASTRSTNVAPLAVKWPTMSRNRQPQARPLTVDDAPAIIAHQEQDTDAASSSEVKARAVSVAVRSLDRSKQPPPQKIFAPTSHTSSAPILHLSPDEPVVAIAMPHIDGPVIPPPDATIADTAPNMLASSKPIVPAPQKRVKNALRTDAIDAIRSLRHQ